MAPSKLGSKLDIFSRDPNLITPAQALFPVRAVRCLWTAICPMLSAAHGSNG